MDSFSDNLIEYIGLSKINLSDYDFKKLCSIEKAYVFEENQSPILDINRAYVNSSILTTKKVPGIMSTNYEGEIFEDSILVCEGSLNLDVEYIEGSEISNINIINIKDNFTEILSLKDYDEMDKLCLEAHILKVCVKKLSKHKLFYYVNIAVVSKCL